jgi:shikimate kinase
MASGRRIYIIGFMGSGKSTTGKKLAEYLGWQFIDLDKEIELKAGQSIRDIFSASGEVHFRELETETLLSLKTDNDTVISTGGGTPCHGSNLDFMSGTGLVVYLKMTPGQLRSRLADSAKARPLIYNINKTELLKYISDKLIEREKYYLGAALIIEGIDLDITALVSDIKTRLETQTPETGQRGPDN